MLMVCFLIKRGGLAGQLSLCILNRLLVRDELEGWLILFTVYRQHQHHLSLFPFLNISALLREVLKLAQSTHAIVGIGRVLVFWSDMKKKKNGRKPRNACVHDAWMMRGWSSVGFSLDSAVWWTFRWFYGLILTIQIDYLVIWCHHAACYSPGVLEKRKGRRWSLCSHVTLPRPFTVGMSFLKTEGCGSRVFRTKDSSAKGLIWTPQ